MTINGELGRLISVVLLGTGVAIGLHSARQTSAEVLYPRG